MGLTSTSRLPRWLGARNTQYTCDSTIATMNNMNNIKITANPNQLPPTSPLLMMDDEERYQQLPLNNGNCAPQMRRCTSEQTVVMLTDGGRAKWQRGTRLKQM